MHAFSKITVLTVQYLKWLNILTNSTPGNIHQWKWKERDNWYSTEITPVLPIAGQKFPRHFEGYLKFLRYFNLYIYFKLSRWIRNGIEWNTKVPWTLFGKHCNSVFVEGRYWVIQSRNFTLLLNTNVLQCVRSSSPSDSIRSTFPCPNRILTFILMFSSIYKQGSSRKILLLNSVSSFHPFVLHELYTSSTFIEPPVIIISVMLTVIKFYH